MTPNSILLFAAGFGTRMAPLTARTPKPLIDVAGKPLLDHALDFCGGLNVVVNVHYLADQIKDHLDNHNIQISDESDGILETGGGLKRALALLQENPVMTMNTDAVWRGANPINVVRNNWKNHMDALLVMIPRDQAVGHIGDGDFDIGTDGRLTRGGPYVYSGLQIVRTDGLANISETAFSMWALWNDFLDCGAMYGVPYTGQWCDVGRPESIPLAEAMIAESDLV